MPKSESFSHLEETLEKAQGLMAKVIEQNKQWSGGGAFEEDIAKAGNLQKEAQIALVEVSEGVILHLCKSMDISVKSANDRFDQAYHIMNLMYHDTKQIQISLEKGESQTKDIKNLEVHLKKFTKHCEETRSYLFNAVSKKKRG